jgi:hypothetical protein
MINPIPIKLNFQKSKKMRAAPLLAIVVLLALTITETQVTNSTFNF